MWDSPRRIFTGFWVGLDPTVLEDEVEEFVGSLVEVALGVEERCLHDEATSMKRVLASRLKMASFPHAA